MIKLILMTINKSQINSLLTIFKTLKKKISLEDKNSNDFNIIFSL